MTYITKSIHSIEKKFDCAAEKFVHRHPVIASITMFIGLPIMLLAAVAGFTMAVMVPVSLLMGWF